MIDYNINIRESKRSRFSITKFLKFIIINFITINNILYVQYNIAQMFDRNYMLCSQVFSKIYISYKSHFPEKIIK